MNTRRRAQFRSYDLYAHTGYIEAAEEIDQAISKTLEDTWEDIYTGTQIPLCLPAEIVRNINPVLDKHRHLGAHDTEPETFIAQILIESIEDRLGIKLTDQITVGQLRSVM